MEDRELKLWSGWGALVVMAAWLGGIVVLGTWAIDWREPRLLWGIVPLFVLWLGCWAGFIVNPIPLNLPRALPLLAPADLAALESVLVGAL